MRTLADFLHVLNLVLFTVVALVAIREWRAGRGKAGVWAAAAFVTLALVVDVAEALPEEPTNDLEWFAERLIVAALVVFPYLLYRFTTAFREATPRLERLLGLMTLALLVWTFLIRDFPDEGEPRSGMFVAYLVAFLAHWTILAVAVTVRLWRAGRGQPSVARRRMQLLSSAAAILTVALFVVAFVPEPGLELGITVDVLIALSALGFLLGIAPPAPLRFLWRRPEQRQLQAAIAELMGAASEQEVVQRVLPPMARMVGARSVVWRDDAGRLVGAYGAADDAAADATGPEMTRFDVPSGTLDVWTSPYAPFFGTEEARLVQTLGALTGLALDRSRLFAQEREARAALERADEVKTSFVALAAHELRTPVATIDGIVQTLDRHPDLDSERRGLLERTLRQQSGHMRRLVDQLLDLSRLDADVIEIDPQPLQVRERVEAAVKAAAGERAGEVRVEIGDDVHAMADATAFERIVSNLVTNAFRYGEPPVLVRAEQRDRHFRLSVEDRGAGVPPEFVPDLFERFTRSRTSRAVTGGTGLGLAIARSYAHAHGGDLLYEAAEPTGARFRLVLPMEPKRNGAG